MELYETKKTIWGYLNHNASGDMIEFRAQISEGPRKGMFGIRYSHTYKPTPESGFYYSDSFTSAESLDEAQRLVEKWADAIEKSPEYGSWISDF